mmetsp:Transcript_478/g.796  ORF Transcript_478/g.796 Transcript_478/m.796 type:complete len:488 (-) Transcript_478:97-1560(-)
MNIPQQLLFLYIALLLPVWAFNIPTRSSSSSSSTDKPLQWLIVGGGPIGVHIATRLLEEVPSMSLSKLCIVDEESSLLHKWKHRTDLTGMVYLRSSSSYHLDVKEDSLKRYADQITRGKSKSKKNSRQPMLFAADYQRPKLDFFNEHCDHVIEKNKLDQVHVQGMVTDVKIDPNDDHVEVEIRQPNGDIIITCAENVVLALGSDAPAYPDWADEEMIHDGKIKHIFDEENEWGHNDQSIAIVGGGISAAHLALKLSEDTRKGTVLDDAHSTTVHMICRHELREQQFDTNQDWMMNRADAKRSKAGGGQGIPKCQRHFESLDSYIERRDVIKKERQAGTISAAVIRGKGGLRYAIDEERIHWHQDDILSVAKEEGSGQLSLSLASGDNIMVDQIILATGFKKSPPASFLINNIAQRYGLELCPCGYPAPDESLRWHKRIYLAGALAELELGPSARNLAGARLASERIVAAALLRQRVVVSGHLSDAGV